MNSAFASVTLGLTLHTFRMRREPVGWLRNSRVLVSLDSILTVWGTSSKMYPGLVRVSFTTSVVPGMMSDTRIVPALSVVK